MLAQLEVEIDGSAQVLSVLKPVSILGKRATCDLVLNHKSVSSQHAKLIVTYNGITIEDLNSTNGTVIKGQRISAPVELKDGDEVQFGAVLVRLRMPKPEDAPRQERPSAVARRKSEGSAARQPEILRVLGEGISVKERLAVLNKEFAAKIFIPSIHWKVRFFLFIAAALVVTALALGFVSSLIAGAQIDPHFLDRLHAFAAENLGAFASGGSVEFSSRSLSLSQNPEITGYYLLDTVGHQLYPRRDDKNPIEAAGFVPANFTGPDTLRGPGDAWYLAESVMLDNNRVGIAFLQFDQKPSPHGSGRPAAIVVMMLIFLIVIGYLFIGLASRVITNPIAQLIVELDEARMGQRPAFSRFSSFPELDRLAQILEQVVFHKET